MHAVFSLLKHQLALFTLEESIETSQQQQTIVCILFGHQGRLVL